LRLHFYDYDETKTEKLWRPISQFHPLARVTGRTGIGNIVAGRRKRTLERDYA